MAIRSLIPLVSRIRRIAENPGLRALTDRELLQGFVADRDQAAFEVLLHRHGELVLAACRQVLSDPADVEDAFQATFLTLLRKAESVRWQQSLGGWLFGAAHRIALQARANACRRRQREAQAAISREKAETAGFTPDLSWHEAVGLLHEELDRLPDRYRLPLLLCYLDGKSRDEAAEQLGVTPGAIKWRLERGRELLRKRLVRRGITLPAGLLGALANSSVAALPPRLVHITLQAATSGPVPASVAALIRGMSAMLGSRTTSAIALVLILGLLGAGASVLGVLKPAAGATPPTIPAGLKHAVSAVPALIDQPAQEKDGQEKRTIVGRVLGPDDKPVANARLYWPRLLKEQPTSEKDVEFPSRGEDGHFLDLPARHDDGEKTFLGKKGHWKGDDLVRLLLEHPATARRLAFRLCDIFMGEGIADQRAMDALARGLREHGLSIAWGVETVLRSRLFFAEKNLGSRVLGPVEFVVGSARLLETFDDPPSTLLLADWGARLGQDLFIPPNVGGWPGGRRWVSTQSMIGRANFVAALVGGRLSRQEGGVDCLALARRHGRGKNLRSVLTFFSELALGRVPGDDWLGRLATAVGKGQTLSPETARRGAALVLASPEAQLA
jgi:RNA polymerase sigma factor (sigma-70 family)